MGVANLEGVDIVIHQNALLDIAEKMTKFYEQVIKNAKHLIGPEAPEQNGDKFNNYTETIEETKPPEPKPMSPKPKFQRMNSRKMSFVKAATSVQVANRFVKKGKSSVSRQNSVVELPTDLKMSAVLKSVSFQLMTSKRNLARM